MAIKKRKKNLKNKFILDACCGGRMFWFNKRHHNALYIDNRKTTEGFYNNPGHRVQPDISMDFRYMKFPDKSFKLVVFDPPHIFCESQKSAIVQEYGSLNKETWREDIKKGFNECWRVLEDFGVLIFKWSEVSVKRADVLKIIEKEPLFGHPRYSKIKNHWYCFMKIPLNHAKDRLDVAGKNKPFDIEKVIEEFRNEVSIVIKAARYDTKIPEYKFSQKVSNKLRQTLLG